MIANSRCIACILSKQERKIRKNSDEQKKKEYIHKVLKILYEYGTKECAPMVEKRIKDIYKEYYEEDVDYGALKHRYNQYMLEKEEEIRAHIQENNDIETCIKYVCAGNYIDFGVANKIDDQLLQGLLDKVNELKISKKEVADGNDMEQLDEAFKATRKVEGKPVAIVMKTVKGKGVSFMENQAGWHGTAPNDEQYAIAMEDLKKVEEALCQK